MSDECQTISSLLQAYRWQHSHGECQCLPIFKLDEEPQVPVDAYLDPLGIPYLSPENEYYLEPE